MQSQWECPAIEDGSAMRPHSDVGWRLKPRLEGGKPPRNPPARVPIPPEPSPRRRTGRPAGPPGANSFASRRRCSAYILKQHHPPADGPARVLRRPAAARRCPLCPLLNPWYDWPHTMLAPHAPYTSHNCAWIGVDALKKVSLRGYRCEAKSTGDITRAFWCSCCPRPLYRPRPGS